MPSVSSMLIPLLPCWPNASPESLRITRLYFGRSMSLVAWSSMEEHPGRGCGWGLAWIIRNSDGVVLGGESDRTHRTHRTYRTDTSYMSYGSYMSYSSVQPLRSLLLLRPNLVPCRLRRLADGFAPLAADDAIELLD